MAVFSMPVRRDLLDNNAFDDTNTGAVERTEMMRSDLEMTCYERAALIAKVFGCHVAIVHNGNDGPGRVWETVAESAGGGFPSTNGFRVHDIVSP
jgi:sugar phosphate isomerase/epimerase